MAGSALFGFIGVVYEGCALPRPVAQCYNDVAMNDMTPRPPDDAKHAQDIQGHRARLRERLVASDGEALHDHEIIEYLLALTIPRRDTKGLAKALLREFGGFGEVMSAPASSLSRVSGIGPNSAAAIRLVNAAVLRLLRAHVLDRPVLGNWTALLDYLRAQMGHRINESVRLLHLDSRNCLMRDELLSEGSVDQSALYVREVVRRALELGTAAIILVHNHPTCPFRSRSITPHHTETQQFFQLS